MNPNTYLEKYLESDSDGSSGSDMGDSNGFNVPFYQPLAEVEYGAEGEVELRTDDILVYYTYRPVEEAPLDVEDVRPLGKPQEWREIGELVMLNESNGAVVQLSNIYPDPHNTVFRVTRKKSHGSYFKPSDRLVAINGVMLSSSACATLLHEVGHSHDEIANPHLYSCLISKMWKDDPADAMTQSMVLARERNAWAFALNVLRPFLSRDPESPFHAEHIRQFIHKSRLQTYSDHMRNKRREKMAALAITSTYA